MVNNARHLIRLLSPRCRRWLSTGTKCFWFPLISSPLYRETDCNANDSEQLQVRIEAYPEMLQNHAYGLQSKSMWKLNPAILFSR